MRNKIVKFLTAVGTSITMIGATAVPALAATPINVNGSTTASSSVDVNFSQKDTIEMSISDNVVNFGEVNMLTTTDALNTLTTTIKSSQNYTLDALAPEDFKTATGDIVPVSKLSVKVDSGEYSNFEKGISKLLSDDAASYETGISHVLSFRMDSTIGYKSGDYTTPLTISVTQK